MPRTITYEFSYAGGASWRYRLEFDDQNQLIPAAEAAPARAWTHLGFQQCSHCPLREAECPQCPVARNLDHIIEDTKEIVSHTRAAVRVVTPERTYTKDCPTQDGLRSIFGLIMATSGCPHLDWLRPLARFHLPFADHEETLFRVLALQLVESFLINRDASLAEGMAVLNERYAEVEKLNQEFIRRIRNYCHADADKNALAALDLFAQFFAIVRDDNFEDLRRVIPTAVTAG
jgi:hypothetical protein